MIYTDKGLLEELEPIDLLLYLNICPIENFKSTEKRIVKIILHENIFNVPEIILDILKENNINKNLETIIDIELYTFLVYVKIITKMNYKRTKLEIYDKILKLIPTKIKYYR